MGGMKCQSAGSARCAAAQGAPAVSARPQRLGLVSWTKRYNVDTPRNWEVQVYSAPVQGCVQSLSRQPRESCVEAPHRPRQASLLVA